MKVLLIEDDKPTADSIQMILGAEQITSHIAKTAEDGHTQATSNQYDLIILDLLLPDEDGVMLLRKLRSEGVNIPVLILSGMDDTLKKVEGLRIGADDYLTKPFDKRELLARVQAIVRRAQGHAQPLVKVGKLEIDLNDRMARVSGAPVNLTNKEYGLLELLAVRRGATISKAQFLSHLYDSDNEPEAKIIDVFVCKLRKKISDMTGGPSYIDTVWGRGYIMRDEATG